MTYSAFVVCGLVGVAVAISAPARAADIATHMSKAPSIAYPATNWSGFYVGAMGGYASQTGDALSNTSLALKGGSAGGTLGYNWQSGQFVGGIETDAAWTDIKNGVTVFGVTAEDRIRSWGTVRARAGVAFDTVYLYATGGYAWADNRISASALGMTLLAENKLHSGWVAGGGMEWMFAPNWSLKAEYLYRNLGSETYLTTVIPGGIPTGTVAFHSGQVGVNLHF
jgi:outer membrane immunogenic protein